MFYSRLVTIIASVSFFFVSVFATALPKPTTTIKVQSSEKTLNDNVSSINVTGALRLVIVQSQIPKVTIKTVHREPITARVRDHVLFIHSPWYLLQGIAVKPTVIVNTPDLEHLTVHGPTNVEGYHIHGHQLTIDADGTGIINLGGDIDVQRITQRGNNHIHLRWLTISRLSIDACGRGSIDLAGIANTVYVHLCDYASLNTKFLRTRMMQIQTNNFATAEVLPIETLRAFARGHSNIYYFKTPSNLTRYSTDFGNVLRVSLWSINSAMGSI